MITFEKVSKHIDDVTSAQVGMAYKVFGPDNKAMYLVENSQGLVDSEGYMIQYTVTYGARGFACTCKAGQYGFANVKHPSGVCWHVRAAVAASVEEKAALKAMTPEPPVQDEDEVPTPAPVPQPQPKMTRWNEWEMRVQTYCCGKWWNGDTCLYGNHCLQNEVPAPTPQPQHGPKPVHKSWLLIAPVARRMSHAPREV